MLKKPLIQYHFDLTSPYSYIGFELLSGHLTKWQHQVDVEFVPIYLAGILNISKNQPPPLNIIKAKWQRKDLQRISRNEQIPLKIMPSVGFPMNSLSAMRILYVLKQEGMKSQPFRDFVSSLYRAYWVDEKDISKQDVLSELLSKHFTTSQLEVLITKSQSEELKAQFLEHNRNLVEKHGVFGAPWTIVKKPGNEKSDDYFGSDRLQMVALDLGLEYHYPSVSIKERVQSNL